MAVKTAVMVCRSFKQISRKELGGREGEKERVEAGKDSVLPMLRPQNFRPSS